jgi:hypothetical protein
MKPRRRRLSQKDLRAMGAAEGLVSVKYAPDGRAVVRQLTAETNPRPPFGPVVTHDREDGQDTQASEGERG